MDIQKNFGLRIKELRAVKGLSQEALSHKAELDRTYITSVENGKRNVSIQAIQKIVKGLDVSFSEFFTSNLFDA
ncbi:helix-turn-helix domain-containing protein [Prolixibacter sp. NT017]|uniref:helix-turn-helix domain-containing protein n=1 Tax=Prolixibacter sp. NT017 TaxID=2652390 RepID=UPI00127AE14B|nr:helix-turn-helix transcriptional regulator [Prolixibacter sp. NT017]GET25070.1 transcriptional regulator [Prolixibacter sp. NT017]